MPFDVNWTLLWLLHEPLTRTVSADDISKLVFDMHFCNINVRLDVRELEP